MPLMMLERFTLNSTNSSRLVRSASPMTVLAKTKSPNAMMYTAMSRGIASTNSEAAGKPMENGEKLVQTSPNFVGVMLQMISGTFSSPTIGPTISDPIMAGTIPRLPRDFKTGFLLARSLYQVANRLVRAISTPTRTLTGALSNLPPAAKIELNAEIPAPKMIPDFRDSGIRFANHSARPVIPKTMKRAPSMRLSAINAWVLTIPMGYLDKCATTRGR
ncbi:MAG: hypothetical protein ACM3X4_11965 [Ignavibacteriales bacterium]